MDVVGGDVVEQALVVGDEEHAALGRAHGVDALGDDLQRVDVEAGVGLVEDAVFRLEHHHLEDLVALLFAAGEAFVHRAGGEFPVHLEVVHLRVEVLVVGDRVDFLALRQARLEGGADEVGVGDAGNFGRILESEEDAGARALVDAHAQQVPAVHGDGAAGNDVAFVAGDHLRERRLAGAVRAHDGVDLAGGNFKGDALEDFGAVFEGGVEVGDEQRH